jgi:signal transduction histidine kinase/DNA-binding response OmpR family regulator
VVSYNASTFHDRDRNLQGVHVSARDMTELKRYEQTLQQTNVELEQASRMKSEFLANMSHELRTPLNAIIGFSELLKDGLVGDLEPRQRGFIGDIFNSGNHLLSLINDILDLSKVEAGKMELDLEPVPVADLFANSLSIIREKAAKRHVRLELDAGSLLGTILVDARKVKQILYNLLSNAVKFSDDGGQVILQATRVPGAQVGQPVGSWTCRGFIAPAERHEEYLRISVSDTGIGIAEEGLNQLFQPFTQIDSGLGRKFEGTGLGLAMVKLLAELHGGAVAMESAEGEGSVFTVWLPMRTDAEPVTDAPAASDVQTIDESAEARTALIVEDDLKSAQLIRLQLEAEGFSVIHAATAEEALILAIQQPLALITLDIMLPDMDGWDLLARFKQQPALRRIPVVVISIAADPTRGFSLGAAAVMQKPISRQDLFEALADLGMMPPRGEALRILVVDDEPAAVEVMAERVMEMTGTVLRAKGGAEAIEMARRELPDVILLDLLMPDVSGFEVVTALQERPETARIPILVITSKQVTAKDRASLNGNVSAIMEKATFRPGQLTDEIRRATRGRKQVV